MKISTTISYLFPMPYEQKLVLVNSEQKSMNRKQMNWKNEGIAHFPHHKWRAKLWPILHTECCFLTYSFHLIFLYKMVSRGQKQGSLGAIEGLRRLKETAKLWWYGQQKPLVFYYSCTHLNVKTAEFYKCFFYLYFCFAQDQLRVACVKI